MVAMSGAIMPDPLAIPLIVTFTPSIIAVAVAALAKVSVVMMASAAAARQWPAAPSRTRSPSTRVILAVGSGSPITPGRGHEHLIGMAARHGGGLIGDLAHTRPDRPCR